MTPTLKLRYAERKIEIRDSEGNTYAVTSVKVLQQWFEYDINYPTETGVWVDIPTVIL